MYRKKASHSLLEKSDEPSLLWFLENFSGLGQIGELLRSPFQPFGTSCWFLSRQAYQPLNWSPSGDESSSGRSLNSLH